METKLQKELKKVKDPYNTLGISKTATDEEIRKAYKKLAKHHHPDRFQDAEEKAKHVEVFKEVNEAHEVLADKAKRAEYDTYGHVGRGRPSGKPFTSPTDDFFRSVFGQRAYARAQPKGEDIVLECHITLDDVFKGGERELKYQQNVLCETCNGVGGTQVACDICGGSGHRIIYGANMTVQTSCEKCSGSGKIVNNNCPNCSEGVKSTVDKTINFTIPMGVENHMKFAFRGQGEPISGGIAGDLFVVVRVRGNDKFQRIGPDLFHIINVPYSTLVLGGKIDVPTMNGEVSLKVPTGTPVGKQFRMRGQGLPRFGRANTFGDQLVEIQLSIPTDISAEHEELIKKLSEFERG